uniref:Uncharacterized protein n=1 Tax=Knipowitschia caucasica TaxID=637954 RepID=A0AAV2MH13_KNICA
MLLSVTHPPLRSSLPPPSLSSPLHHTPSLGLNLSLSLSSDSPHVPLSFLLLLSLSLNLHSSSVPSPPRPPSPNHSFIVPPSRFSLSYLSASPKLSPSHFSSPLQIHHRLSAEPLLHFPPFSSPHLSSILPPNNPNLPSYPSLSVPSHHTSPTPPSTPPLSPYTFQSRPIPRPSSLHPSSSPGPLHPRPPSDSVSRILLRRLSLLPVSNLLLSLTNPSSLSRSSDPHPLPPICLTHLPPPSSSRQLHRSPSPQPPPPVSHLYPFDSSSPIHSSPSSQPSSVPLLHSPLLHLILLSCPHVRSDFKHKSQTSLSLNSGLFRPPLSPTPSPRSFSLSPPSTLLVSSATALVLSSWGQSPTHLQPSHLSLFLSSQQAPAMLSSSLFDHSSFPSNASLNHRPPPRTPSIRPLPLLSSNSHLSHSLTRRSSSAALISPPDSLSLSIHYLLSTIPIPISRSPSRAHPSLSSHLSRNLKLSLHLLSSNKRIHSPYSVSTISLTSASTDSSALLLISSQCPIADRPVSSPTELIAVSPLTSSLLIPPQPLPSPTCSLLLPLTPLGMSSLLAPRSLALRNLVVVLFVHPSAPIASSPTITHSQSPSAHMISPPRLALNPSLPSMTHMIPPLLPQSLIQSLVPNRLSSPPPLYPLLSSLSHLPSLSTSLSHPLGLTPHSQHLSTHCLHLPTPPHRSITPSPLSIFPQALRVVLSSTYSCTTHPHPQSGASRSSHQPLASNLAVHQTHAVVYSPDYYSFSRSQPSSDKIPTPISNTGPSLVRPLLITPLRQLLSSTLIPRLPSQSRSSPTSITSPRSIKSSHFTLHSQSHSPSQSLPIPFSSSFGSSLTLKPP